MLEIDYFHSQYAKDDGSAYVVENVDRHYKVMTHLTSHEYTGQKDNVEQGFYKVLWRTKWCRKVLYGPMTWATLAQSKIKMDQYCKLVVAVTTGCWNMYNENYNDLL